MRKEYAKILVNLCAKINEKCAKVVENVLHLLCRIVVL